MSTPQQFSHWLAGTSTGAIDLPALQQMVEQYPYFWPAGLLQMLAGEGNEDHDNTARLRQLYATSPARVMLEIALGSHLTNADDSTERDTFESVFDNEPAGQLVSEEQDFSQSESSIAHSLEHDPLEDAVAQTFGSEEGGAVHNVAAPSAEESDVHTRPDAIPLEESEPVPQPLFTSDYFSHQGVQVNAEMPAAEAFTTEQHTALVDEEDPTDADRGLMVMRSFADWMQHFQQTTRKAQEEEESKKAVRAMWQKEKLAAALEEEEEEIPEEVFQMAVASIAPDGMVSESLAEILAAQGKSERAVEMYRKLSAQEPAKSAYFARKIEALEARHSA
jgi:hypothetical protein